jgi:hypothetical protein
LQVDRVQAIKDLAQAMIDLHGEDAEMEAAQRGDELLAQGNEAGARAWSEVTAASAEPVDRLADAENR